MIIYQESQIILYYIRKELHLKTISRLRIFFLFLFILGLLSGAADGESVTPLPPESPPPYKADRPTAAPTEEPPDVVVDHVNRPDIMPKFFFPEGSKLLEIWIPNIKDADAALLYYEGTVYMIDCGDQRAAARTVLLLKQLMIEKIDILFNSHLHHDHIDGLEATNAVAKIGKIKICFQPALTASGLKMVETAMWNRIPVSEYKDGDVFTMGEDGEVTLQFWKNNEKELDINSQSALTKVTYGERSILFTADVEKPGQEIILKRLGPEALKSDILKYPHHGKTDMLMSFYNAVGAKLVVITSVAGRDDSGQRFLKAREIPLVFTSLKGMFTHLVTDGHYWLCEYVPITVE